MLHLLQDVPEDLVSSYLSKVVSSSAYHEATFQNDVKRVQMLIRSGVDINQRESTFHFTPIFLAIFNENLRIVKMMVQAGADLNVKAKFNMTPLCCAVETGNINMVTRLLDLGANIEAKDEKNNSLVHTAASCGLPEMIKFLIERGLSVNCRNDNDETPLHKAVRNEQKEAVKMLLTHGADVNVVASYIPDEIPEDSLNQESEEGFLAKFKEIRQDKYCTTLIIAVIKKRIDLVEILIQAGADVNTKTNLLHLSPLHFAIGVRSLQLIKLLLKAGSDVNAKSAFDTSPLLLAVISNEGKIVETLLEVAEIEVNCLNDKGSTPLTTAASNGLLSIVKMLVMRGALINGAPSEAFLPLHKALFFGKEHVVNWLINNGASVRARDSRGLTAIMAAVMSKDTTLKMIETLMKKGGNINSKCKGGCTALHYAAASGNLRMVRFLIDQGANPNEKDKEGHTVLHFAIRSECIKTAEYLIDETGVDLNGGPLSPLLWAVGLENQDMVKLLLKKGANVNVSTCYGTTPLHLAVREGYQPITELLLKYKPNLEFRTSQGSTALFLAVKNQHEKIVEALLDKGADPNDIDDSGNYPIHVAINSGNVNVVKALLNKGAYFDAVDDSINSPLDLARKTGNVKLITLLELIKKLFLAIAKKEFYQIECCIQAGAIVNARNSNAQGKTALHFAVLYKNVKAINLLLAHKADISLPTDLEKVSLHYAVSGCDLVIVETLLAHATELSFTKRHFFINASSIDYSNTPLHNAARKNNFKAVKLLIEHGAVYNMKNDDGETPFHLTTDKTIKDFLCLIQKLFEVVKIPDGSKEVLKIVGSQKSVINARDSDEGRTPLVWAILKNLTTVAENLLKCRADYFLVTDQGATPLHISASKGNLKMIKTLLNRVKSENLEKMSDFVNAPTENGSTALHIATSLDIVRCLLQEGAIYNMTNGGGKTLYELTKNSDIRKFLQTVDNFFKSVKEDTSTMMNSLVDLDEENFKAITSARHQNGQTLLQAALAHNKMKVVSKILEKLRTLS
ncbi:uncharacterized protein [Bemisia tabaci]|uniref:uncharacterized protein n=1 Tax=Bemisia tabaci TaxID=7038 RepID=UPI003B28D050